ncbi:hypothetical protein CRUP_004493, partial [Coryphaenoides rupestris]
NKHKERYLEPLQTSEHIPYILELNFLRENNSEVIKATQEAEKTLKMEATENEGIKGQLEKQKSLNDNLQSQIERARKDKAKLLAAKLHLGKSCQKCPEGWTLLNSTCYFFSKLQTDSLTKRNWPDSRQDCVSRQADLLVIDNWAEQQLLNDNLPKLTVSAWWAYGFWMGLTQISEDNTWVWINNVTQQSPFYWIPGEPTRLDEHCAAFYPTSDSTKTWYDGRCHKHEFYWICEMKPKAP